MADSFEITMETKEVEKLISNLLKRIKNPKKLMKTLERWVHAQTMLMFRGKRPDNTAVRGMKWPKLAKSTIKQKKARVARGVGIVANRPMVDTGKLRDSLKVLKRSHKGFVYGTKVKSKKGFHYPGYWNNSKFVFLFFNKIDFAQISRMTVDFLNDRLERFSKYKTG